jgi:hypothetical protein
MATEIPIACTLSATDCRARLAEIAAPSRDALRHVERRGLTLDLPYAPEAAARVRQLVKQERTCCAFLQFDLQESADEVQSTAAVTSPEARATACKWNGHQSRTNTPDSLVSSRILRLGDFLNECKPTVDVRLAENAASLSLRPNARHAHAQGVGLWRTGPA